MRRAASWLRSASALGVAAWLGVTSGEAAGNLGKDFWIAWPDTWLNSAEVIILTDAPQAKVTLSGAFSASGTAAIGSPLIISVPAEAEVGTNGLVEDKGIHITSDADISVIFRTPAGEASVADEAYLALPTAALGQTYFVLNYRGLSASGFLFKTGYLLVATQNNTNINAGGALVTLNQGQTFQRLFLFQDSTGTRITSDKPVAMFVENLCPFVPETVRGCNPFLEQLLPVEAWGAEYLTAPLFSPNSGDLIRVLASQAATHVLVVDGTTTTPYTLAAGQFVELDTNSPTRITSDKPILVAQYAKGHQAAGSGDPFEMQIMPSALFRTSYRFFVPAGYSQGNFATIIVPTPGTSVSVDGSAITTGFSPLPGGGQFLQVSLEASEHTVTASHPVGVYVHGYREFSSYGYPAGFSFNRPPVANAGVARILECSDPTGTPIVLDGSGSSDPEGDPLSFTWTGPFGTLTGQKVTTALPYGTHTITLAVSDAKGASAGDTLVVTVRDTTPSSLTFTLSPSLLWPPNHQLVEITAQIQVSDLCDPNPSVTRIATTSSEPDAGTGAGDLGNDIQRNAYRTDDRSFFLRAERDPTGPGRTYTVTYEARDAAGNTTSATTQVRVSLQLPKP